MLTFLTMAVAQSLIVTLGNIFLLGVDVQNPVYSVLFAVLIGLAFMMIVYVLAALFDNVGKGLAIIILVLSISGGGGTTRSSIGKFFQMINPFLPFTHAVNLLERISRRNLLAKRHPSHLDHDRSIRSLWHSRNSRSTIRTRKKCSNSKKQHTRAIYSIRPFQRCSASSNKPRQTKIVPHIFCFGGAISMDSSVETPIIGEGTGTEQIGIVDQTKIVPHIFCLRWGNIIYRRCKR